MRRFAALIIITTILLCNFQACRQNSPAPLPEEKIPGLPEVALSAWADTPRARIERWVTLVTDTTSPDFIPEEDRIAVFDNDGTLWPEQPVPTQMAFTIDMIKSQAANRPEWQKNMEIKGILNNDFGPLKKAGIKGLLDVIDATHSKVSTDAFDQSVRNWIDTARDTRFGRLYKEVIYLPMIQLLEYLRSNGFKTFIVSGGGADFMRVWTQEAYGIPSYQVVGSYGQLAYEVVDGKPRINKVSGDAFIDDKSGKPVAIRRFIGKVPVFCGGNSDGDQAMMQYTSGSPYKSFCVLIHHTDSAREYAYDVKTLSGHLESALVEASEKNWLVVDMKNDWKNVFPFEKN